MKPLSFRSLGEAWKLSKKQNELIAAQSTKFQSFLQHMIESITKEIKDFEQTTLHLTQEYDANKKKKIAAKEDFQKVC